MDQFILKPLPLVFAVMTTLAAVAACSSSSVPAGMPERVQDAARSAAAENLHKGELPILRFQVDATRDRVWILAPSGVYLYDPRSRQRVAHRRLADWHWAGEPFSCAPDLALGRKGEVLVTSDILPVVWRVDPDTLEVTRHELALDADADKDVGFSGLVSAAGHGGFFAVSPLHGSLWRIDASLSRAQKIPLSSALPRACGLSVEPRALLQQRGEKASLAFDLCARAGDDRHTILLSPDQRSGHISSRPCAT